MDMTKREFLKSAGLMILSGTAASFAITARLAHAKPLPKTTVWVHGNTIQQENTVAGMSMKHYGRGTEIKMDAGKARNWFHVPFTTVFTPQAPDNLPNRLSEIYLLFRTDYAQLTAIHVWDGAKKIKEFNGLEVYGDHSTSIDQSNQFIINPTVQISTGLGISFHVNFVSKYGASFMLATAGAGFLAT